MIECFVERIAQDLGGYSIIFISNMITYRILYEQWNTLVFCICCSVYIIVLRTLISAYIQVYLLCDHKLCMVSTRIAVKLRQIPNVAQTLWFTSQTLWFTPPPPPLLVHFTYANRGVAIKTPSGIYDVCQQGISHDIYHTKHPRSTINVVRDVLLY